MLDFKEFNKKLHDEKGESLVETIVAFLVITIALLAFAAMATFGFNLTTQAEILDKTDTDLTGNVTVTYESTGYSTTYEVKEASA